MRLHSLEHEPFEGLANIEVWAKNYNNVPETNLILDLLLDTIEREFGKS